MANKIGNGNLEKRKGRGRPKGSQNKTTVAAKEAIQMAFEGIGGAQRLTEWIKLDPEHEKAFWVSIYPKLLPLQVNAEGGIHIHLGADAKKA